jgi:hypothetical protein
MVIWTIKGDKMLFWPVVVTGRSPRLIQYRPAGDLSGISVWVEQEHVAQNGQIVNGETAAKIERGLEGHQFTSPYIR